MSEKSSNAFKKSFSFNNYFIYGIIFVIGDNSDLKKTVDSLPSKNTTPGTCIIYS